MSDKMYVIGIVRSDDGAMIVNGFPALGSSACDALEDAFTNGLYIPPGIVCGVTVRNLNGLSFLFEVCIDG